MYKKTYRGYLVDHHTPDLPGVGFGKLDASEWERFIDEAHLDHLMLYCKDHWGYSYYDTAIGKKHPALGDRDWVEELFSGTSSLGRAKLPYGSYWARRRSAAMAAAE